MKTILSLVTATAALVFSTAGLAGVAPTHDASQLSQSGAKIAPPAKQTDDHQKKDEEAKKD